MDRRCEFWLEFENGSKMFAEMLDPVPAKTDLIPSQSTAITQIQSPTVSKKEVQITEDNMEEGGDRSRLESKGSILKSAHGNRNSSMNVAAAVDENNHDSLLSEAPSLKSKKTIVHKPINDY